MKAPSPPCLLFTGDEELARRVKAYCPPTVRLHPVASAGDLQRNLDVFDPAILLFDLRGRDSLERLHKVRGEWPDTLIVAFGTSGSEPVRRAKEAGVYAVTQSDFNGSDFQALLDQALDRQALAEELRILRAGTGPSSPPGAGGRSLRSEHPPVPNALQNFSRPLRHFDNANELLQSLVEGIAAEDGVLRAGIFAGIEDSDAFRLCAGVGCFEDTRSETVARDDFLVRWLELNAQLVCRNSLDFIADSADRHALQRVLDALGAELIAPLQGRNRLLGWLFVGRRATGRPFGEHDLRDIMGQAEHAAIALENAILYREVALQKGFAETLLHSVPTGIIAVGKDYRIRWFNDSAERILGHARETVMNRSVDRLGNPLAAHLRRALHEAPVGQESIEWNDDARDLKLSLRTARLLEGAQCWGAVGFVQDLTREHQLNRKQRELDRASFWTELAASMSHEIRNPLVAIKTFAQLLPERYAEKEFRHEFSQLVTQEVDRLNSIITQINQFADPPGTEIEAVDVSEMLRRAGQEASVRVNNGVFDLAPDLPGDLPAVFGDRRALVDCFTHILANAMEASLKANSAKIGVSARSRPGTNGTDGWVEIAVRDQASGIPEDIRDDLFSPFCTTKDRAMGLGLAIAHRTVSDHDGRIEIESDKAGTSVTVSLPTQPEIKEETE